MSKKRMKPGPKPRAARDRRRLKVQIPVSATEMAMIRRAAGGQYLGRWGRSVLLAAAMRDE